MNNSQPSALLRERSLPPLQSREKMLDILQNEIYGYLPPEPENLHFTVESDIVNNFCAGKATCHKITACGLLGGRPFSFPFYASFPSEERKYPFFVHINFRENIPDQYQPTEELIDNGFAVLSFNYNGVTRDNDDFLDGLAGAFYPDGVRTSTSAPGKIALWAWAAHRVMDYAATRPDVLDLDCAIVCGHSRLGKTALLAAATDTRFAFAYSNDSGCAGASITRGKQGETTANICRQFPYWFCDNYKKYMDREYEMPFDQHFLVASIAPRKVLIGNAAEDWWSDPLAEQLCCVAASPAFRRGFVCPDHVAAPGEAFLQGDIGYHLRKGLHYFSRTDWHRLMEFVRLHREERKAKQRNW
jgi:hypothetical protein